MNNLDDIKTQILSRIKLNQLVSEQVELSQKSGRFLGCCPFHEEKTPSFYLFDDHYHCFGCGAHGDAIAFLMGYMKMSLLIFLGQIINLIIL